MQENNGISTGYALNIKTMLLTREKKNLHLLFSVRAGKDVFDIPITREKGFQLLIGNAFVRQAPNVYKERSLKVVRK